MAKAKKSAKAATGRGSPEAIEKRRVARRLNSILMGGSSSEPKRDGRTEKRRVRLIAELKGETDGESLKPLEIVSNVQELLSLGETVASIKKHGVKPTKIALDAERIGAIESAQATYKFPIEAWRFLGVTMEANGKVRSEVVAPPAKGKRGGRKRKG